jgi:protein TonB
VVVLPPPSGTVASTPAPAEIARPAGPDRPASTAAVSRPPEVIERHEPAYPESARKSGVGGTIVLKILVDESGRPVRVVVDQGIPGSELESAAIHAVLRWKFRPGLENGRPTRSWITERFAFAP